MAERGVRRRTPREVRFASILVSRICRGHTSQRSTVSARSLSTWSFLFHAGLAAFSGGYHRRRPLLRPVGLPAHQRHPRRHRRARKLCASAGSTGAGCAGSFRQPSSSIIAICVHVPADRLGRAAAAARRRRAQRAALLLQLALPRRGERLLRRRCRQEPVPAFLVAEHRGAVLLRASRCAPGARAAFAAPFPAALLGPRRAVRRFRSRASSTGRGWMPNHAYYGTDARFYQLLAGALLACALRPWLPGSASAPRPS